MKSLSLAIIFTGILLFNAEMGMSHANYTGYSGAPGARGMCSISCHEQHDFTSTITVTGFPGSYVPGQQYTIAIAHSGGTTIKNFNSSIRIGTGSANAGAISAGTGTSTYNVSQETNGVHFSSLAQNSGNFLWTAPAAGTGDVRLYWSGLQGNLSTGSDTFLVLVSSELATGVDEDPALPLTPTLAQNYPNPFNSETIIEFTLAEPGSVELEISNILGQKVFSWSDNFAQAGRSAIHWNGRSDSGNEVPSGVYFYRLHTSNGDLSRRMVLLR